MKATILGLTAALLLLWTLSLPADANDPGQQVYMIRMLSCKGANANMEVYIPQSIALNGFALARVGTARDWLLHA